MRPLALSQIAAWTGGRLSGADRRIDAVATDTRKLVAGSLFVALRGERYDGHEFVAAAAAAGALALLVEREVASALPQVRVNDTGQALADLAARLLQTRCGMVLALTGSNGKTSVKNLLAGILGRVAPTWATPGNLNNEVGLPLAVLQAPEDARYAIYEMGAGKPGDIAWLCAIAPPQVALVNNVGLAHVERLGSLQGIAETKCAIYEALPDDGIAVINADDAFSAYFSTRSAGRRLLRYGIEQDAEISARGIERHAEGSRFRLCTPVGEALLALPLPGRHNVLNALAAAAMALAAGAPLAAVVEGLQAASPVPGRLHTHRLGAGNLLIDDSYNANPDSLLAAIDSLAVTAGEAWLVLGDMRELGPQGAALHAECGRKARAAGLSRLWTVGELAGQASLAFGEGGRHFAAQQDLVEALGAALAGAEGVRCLVKGSRGSAMDQVVAGLLARENPHAA